MLCVVVGRLPIALDSSPHPAENPAMSLFLLVLAAAPVLPPATTSPEPERQLVRAIYEELVNTSTSYETGKTTPAAEAMAKRLLDAGFSREDVFLGGAAPHKANVVVRYRGTGGARPLLVLAHLDVVEARKEDRSFDLRPAREGRLLLRARHR